MYKLIFYVPEISLEVVKQAVFQSGAGRIGNYERCSFQTRGEGQFMPLNGSNPHLGDLNQLEKVIEYKVETICPKDKLIEVIKSLRGAHPYEEPAIDVYELVNFEVECEK